MKKLTTSDIKQIFPGNWLNSPDENYSSLSLKNGYYIDYYHDTDIWALEDDSNYKLNQTLEQAKKFYKKHMKMRNFK